MEKCFQNVKNSLYQDVKKGIEEMNTECAEKRVPINDILISGPSMINKMNFRKKQNEKYQNSIIHKSNIMRNQSSFRAPKQMRNNLN